MRWFKKQKKESKLDPQELCEIDEWKSENCIMKTDDDTAKAIANLVLDNNQFLIKQSRGGKVKVIYKGNNKPIEYQSIAMGMGLEMEKGNEMVEIEGIISKLTELDNAGNDEAGGYLVPILTNMIQLVKPLWGGRRTKRRRAKRRTSRKRITRRGGSLKRKNRRRRRTLKRRRRRK